MTPSVRAFFAVSLPLVLADGLTKELAARGLQPPQVPHPLLGDWFRVTLTFNRQGPMGLTLGSWSRPAFAALALCALGVLGFLLRRTPPADRLRASALGLLAAGAAGNLWDGLRWGHGVVDFIDIGLGQHRFWTFNIADASLTVGVALMAWVLWREGAATRRAPTRP
jgi:signal peptidase II